LAAGLGAVPAICQAHSQAPSDNLTVVNNAGGGEFVYGSLSGQSSTQDALVYMLHAVHGHFGDKPQVGKLFSPKDGASLAAFFTVNAKKTDGKPVSGLVIVSKPASGFAQAAVLYDSASRFVSSEPSLLKALSAAWRTSATAQGGSSSQGHSAGGSASDAGGGAERLYPATAGDRSATISLPESWHLNRVSGGQLVAEGSHGELVGLGLIFQGIVDPRNPQAQNMARIPGYNSSPHILCALNPNLFADFVSVFNQVRNNNHKAQGTFNLISSRNLGADGGPVAPIEAIFNVDFHDDMGPRKGSARIGVMWIKGSPTWAMTVSMSYLPEKNAEKENATLMAVIHSYSQDANVIGREGAADLERIHQDGERAKIQADAANQRREASTQAFDGHMQQLNQQDSAFEQHMGNIDWQSKISQDYILDRSNIRDTADTVHATTSNSLADLLVKSNPNKLEYIPNQQLIQGVDY
jgi:hypothetical protein